MSPTTDQPCDISNDYGFLQVNYELVEMLHMATLIRIE